MFVPISILFLPDIDYLLPLPSNKRLYFYLPAVRVWILYCQFMMDIMEGENSLEGVRSIFEKAIIAAGLHVTEVCLLILVFCLIDLNL